MGYALLEQDRLPLWYKVPEGRVKPWGTNHAVMAAAEVVKEPFAVINAGDFYGHNSFRIMSSYLTGVMYENDRYCVIGYPAENTLSEQGGVPRTVCGVDRQGYLTSMTEHREVCLRDGRIVCTDKKKEYEIPHGTMVSMDFFGFTPDYFARCEEEFIEFLEKHDGDLKAECHLSSVVGALIAKGRSRVRVLGTDSEWFGTTHREERTAAAKIEKLIEQGVYPRRLWR